jgi:dipeptidyl aminopeptidase/acylaminoacyl peptidase
MELIKKYISDLKNISWISYDENSDAVFYQENSVVINSNKRKSKIFKLELQSDITSEITEGDNDSTPKISPDGKNLAYIKKNKISDNLTLNSLIIKDLSNGNETQITSNNQTISTTDSTGAFNWNNESSHIAYTYRNIEERDNDSEPYVVNRIRYRQDIIGWLGDELNKLSIYCLNHKDNTSVPNSGGDDTHPIFSNDGKYLAFISDQGDSRDTHYREDIHVFDINSSERKRITTYFNGIGSITWSNDDKYLFIIGTSDSKEGDGRNSSLFKIDMSNVSISNLNTEEFAFNPQPNLKMINENLRLSYTDKGISKIVDIHNDNKSVIYDNNSKILQLIDSISKTIFIENNRNIQDVIKVLNKTNGEIKDVVTINSKFYQNNLPSIMNKFSITRNVFDIESRVYLPSDFSENNVYPLIVDIHGGPHGRFEDQIALNQEIFTKSGYIVIAVNPRGSSSYGSDFGKAVLNDWGGEDYHDIIESVNKLSKEKYIDSSKIGLYGYSYGGFMSSWIIGHTNQFKAAVIGAPCINLNSMSGTSDIGIKFGEEQWGGLRYDNVEKYQFNSPLTYAKNVTTPSIILVGDRDYRCPIEQAEQYFVTLKRMGNDVQLVRYPGGNHGMLSGSAPNLVIDYWTRAVNFFDKNLK